MAAPVRVNVRGRPLNEMKFLIAWLRDVGDGIRVWMQAHNRNATGKTSKSIRILVDKPNSAQLDALSSIDSSLAGRGAGKPPPIAPLKEWAASSKGRRIAAAADMTVNQLAYAVQTNIGKFGWWANTQTLSAAELTAAINKLGEPHLSDLADFEANKLADQMVDLLVRDIPNTTEK